MTNTADIFSDDYYKVLGLPKTASAEEIGKAYKKLARKHHPDKNSPDDKEGAEQRFKRISEAYSVLSDAEKKKVYDQFGTAGLSGNAGGRADAPNFGGGAAGNFSSEDAERLFSMFFGGQGMSMAGGAQNGGNFVFTSAGGMPSEGAFQAGFPGGNDPFGQAFDLSGLLGGSSFMAQGQGRQRRQQTPYAIPAGRDVVVHGLSKASQHNGKSGKVMRFDEARMRYEVSIDSEVIALRPQNITQKLQVEVCGLQKKPELNGAVAEIFNYQDETDRYTLFVQQPPQAVALQPENCLFREGTAVTLRNLSNNRYNGEMGNIVTVDRVAGRYRVKCRNGDEVAVKFEKVLC